MLRPRRSFSRPEPEANRELASLSFETSPEPWP
jgi:hypothetical protein